MAHNMMLNMAAAGASTALLSLEMSEESVYGRMMSTATEISAAKFLFSQLTKNERKQARKQWAKTLSQVEKNGGSMRIWEPGTELDMADALAVFSMYDVDVVFVDYMGLLGGMDGEDQWRRLGNEAKAAKLWARSNDKVAVLLAQLNEEGNIKYSRTIKEHADNVWVWTCSEDDKNEGVITVRQAKARNQRTFDMRMDVDFSTMKMSTSKETDFEEESGDGENVVKMEDYLGKVG